LLIIFATEKSGCIFVFAKYKKVRENCGRFIPAAIIYLAEFSPDEMLDSILTFCELFFK
jgi:hypothetical protein